MRKTITKIITAVLSTALTVLSPVHAMENPTSWSIQTRQGETITFKWLSLEEFIVKHPEICKVTAAAFSQVYPMQGLDTFLKEHFIKKEANNFTLSEKFIAWFNKKLTIEEWSWWTGKKIVDKAMPQSVLQTMDKEEAERFLDAYIAFFNQSITKTGHEYLVSNHRNALVQHAKQQLFTNSSNEEELDFYHSFHESKSFFPLIAFRNKEPIGVAFFGIQATIKNTPFAMTKYI